MSQATLAWAALKNMLRAAARDPLWAFVALFSAPFRYGKAVFQIGLFYLIVVFAVRFALDYATSPLGIVKGDVLWYVGNIAFTAFLVLFVFRLASLPLIRHFGDMDADTHGSARFATNKEARPLTRASSGLLIGRDPKS